MALYAAINREEQTLINQHELAHWVAKQMAMNDESGVLGNE
jgi:hypothetical protein